MGKNWALYYWASYWLHYFCQKNKLIDVEYPKS